MFRYNEKKLQTWYGELESDRDPYLKRAEKAAEYTLPWWIRTEMNDGRTYDTPYQSIGAEGVINLASRLNMVLMPPNRPMFRLRIARATLEETVGNQQKEQAITEVNNSLSRAEIEVTGLIEGTGDRAALNSALIHLLIAGNVLLYVPKEAMRVYSLKNYVIQRDIFGNVITIIVKEEIAYEALPKKIRRAIKAQRAGADEQALAGELKNYAIYTAIHRVDDKWHVWQECEDTRIGKPGTYPLDECPWIPLRLYRSEEEDYGRGYVEQFDGSLHAITVLSRAIVQAAGAAAKVLFLVHPGAVTKPDALSKADNLSFILGQKTDIDVLQIEKYNDLQVEKAQVKELTQSLSKVFLLNSAIQRNAERVTAEEIRYMAQELETALGGLYSVLAKEFQKPYITLRLKYFQESGEIPTFGDDIRPQIITGVDALGRGQDANTLVQFGQTVFKTLPPDAIASNMNVHGYMKALAAAYGIDDTTILKTEEQIRSEQQQAQQQQLMQSVAPNAVNAGGRLMEASMKNEQTT